MPLTISNNNTHFLFTTPVLNAQWQAAAQHNAPLKDIILRKESEAPGRALSNQGGWQSDDDLWTWPHASINALYQWVQFCIVQMYESHHAGNFRKSMAEAQLRLRAKDTAWANINRRGHANSIHNHPGATWSGVYYVQVPDDSGWISFLDPRPGVNMMDCGHELLDVFRDNMHHIEPREGMTLLFPGWLLHMVDLHQNDVARISIAFNAKLFKEPLP